MGIYSVVRSIRWAATNYPAGRYGRLLRQSVHWSREELVRYRDDKLRRLIAHCYDNVPYYYNLMNERNIKPEEINSVEDLTRLPILTKETVRKYSNQLLAKNISEMSVSWTMTGGTTGEPMRICKNKECGAWSAMCYERGLEWAGKRVDEPRILLFGGSLGMDKAKLITRIGNAFRRDLLLPAFELREENAALFFDKIRRIKSHFIMGYASALYRLAVLARATEQRIRFTAALPTAELMLPEWEEAIRNTFQCSVLPFYGCGEVNSLGFSAPQSDGYLIPEEHAVIEVMDGEDSTQLCGRGRFLVTDLDNYAMPIIRYLNGDTGLIAGPKGDFPFNRIEELGGRYNGLLMTDQGDLISGVIGTHVFRLTSSVQTYRIIQEEPLRIVINIVPKDNLDEKDRSLIVGLFKKYLGSGMNIAIEIVPDLPALPSGKSVFVINRCLS